MNQTTRKYAVNRLMQMTITKLKALETEDTILLAAHNEKNELTNQEMIDCLALDLAAFTNTDNSKPLINVEAIRNFLCKTQKIGDYLNYNSDKRLTFNTNEFKFIYSAELLKRAKNVLAHYHETTDALMLGTDEEAKQALENFNSKIF